MNAHDPACVVEGYESLNNGLQLSDRDDRHVIAAAIKRQAEGVITFNLRDVPDEALAPFELAAIHPDTFLSDMFELSPAAAIKAAQNQRRALRNPSMSVDEYLNCLQRQKLPNWVSHLRQYSEIL